MAKLNNISEFSKILSCCNSALYDFIHSLKLIKFAQILGGMKVRKRSGMPVMEVILEMLVFILGKQSIRGGAETSPVKSAAVKSHKNTFYNFASSGSVNFRRLLHSVVAACLKRVSGGKKRFMVFDDTAIVKTGRRIEGVSKIHDHTDNTYPIGYKNLTATITDGSYNFVYDFALVGESKNDEFRGLGEEDFRRQFRKERGHGSVSAGRVGELTVPKTELCLRMIRHALKTGLAPDYVLCDSWFSTPDFVSKFAAIAQDSAHLVCMLKAGKCTCNVDGASILLSALVADNRNKKFLQSRKHGCKYLKINCLYGGIKSVIYLVRPKKGDAIFILLTTDTTLKFNDVFEYYHLRWSIEVTFRDCKQHLGLSGCHCRDFDSQICHTTLCYLIYNVLSFHLYIHGRVQTFDGLLAGLHAECVSATLWDKLMTLVRSLLLLVGELFSIDLNLLVQKILSGTLSENPALKALVALIEPDNQQVTK